MMNPDPAFPATGLNGGYFGMSKREYFAAIALQGLLCNGAHRLQVEEGTGYVIDEEGFAQVAVEMAEALIKELNQG